MSETLNEKLPETKALINEDGVLDEKAAGEAIDKVMAEANKQLLEVEVDIDTEPMPTGDGDDSSGDDNSTVEDWVKDEDIQEVMKSAGYSEEDIQGFNSAQDFQKHVELLDRKFKDGRLNAGEDLELALEVDDKIQHDAEQAWQKRDLPKLDPEEFDERLISALEARDSLIKELEERLDNSTQGNLLSSFDNIVDDLDMSDVFGDAKNPTKESTKQRERLWNEYSEMYNSLEARGKPTSGRNVNRGIVMRALNLEFADEVKTANRRGLTSKAKRQSKRILGSNSSTSNVHFDGDVTKDPYLLEQFAQMQKENG
tara:strand:+ start:3410 stop:4348 length:939 start_codon:yes stop_codon:yes gene_type:complete